MDQLPRDPRDGAHSSAIGIMIKPILLYLALFAIIPLFPVAAADQRDAQDDATRLEPSVLLHESAVRAARFDGPWLLLEHIAGLARLLEADEAPKVIERVARVLEERKAPLARHSRWAVLA